MNWYAIIAIIVWLAAAVVVFLDMRPHTDDTNEYVAAVVVLPILAGALWVVVLPLAVAYAIGFLLRKLHIKILYTWNKS